MPLMFEERNALVDMGENPNAPQPPGKGVAIRFAFDAEARFKPGEPLLLHGAFQADRAMLERAGGTVASLVFLTLLRSDKPYGSTLRLIVPPSERGRPASFPPNLLGDYREGGTFKVDLAKFFELPAEPGSYTVLASMAGHLSDPIEFDILAR
ncbi:MAG TPA: hypothetical protein VNE39_02900 [Planctomycetota bacterium]|nr:hypothetical protein [Planctomycetota bacterium]